MTANDVSVVDKLSCKRRSRFDAESPKISAGTSDRGVSTSDGQLWACAANQDLLARIGDGRTGDSRASIGAHCASAAIRTTRCEKSESRNRNLPPPTKHVERREPHIRASRIGTAEVERSNGARVPRVAQGDQSCGRAR
jgi:hypothetical protein